MQSKQELYFPVRKVTRLKGFDYSDPGDYFITICVENYECLFGNVLDGRMILNKAGEMVQKWLSKLENKFENVETDIHQVMPNHLHLILNISSCDGRPRRVAPTVSCDASSSKNPSVPEIINWLKTMVTNEYIRGVKAGIYSRFEKRIFERGYYDHIITNERSYDEIYDYITSNPSKWEEDKNHPSQMLRMASNPKNLAKIK